MGKVIRRLLLWGVVAAALLGLGAGIALRVLESGPDAGGPGGGRGGASPRAVAVEVANVEQGLIEERRTFSGTVQAAARFVVSSRVSGRVQQLLVDIGDPVSRRQVIAKLDDDEFVQAVAQEEAELEVARANLAQAHSALEIAQREYERVETLRQRGVASESQFDAVVADHRAKQAAVEVAQAQVHRAEASVRSARIRLGYTDVAATWSEGDALRVVGERFVEVGDTVAANAPLVSVVDINQVNIVVYITEKDYTRMQQGQRAELRTDAYPGRLFEGRVTRLSPVFREASRQARVEVSVPNPDHALKPGMFARLTVVLDEARDATIVPRDAIVRREGQTGIFALDDETFTVRFVPVTLGIIDGRRAQVLDAELTGRVVTLGQQLLRDGSAVHLPGVESTRVAADPSSATEVSQP